jgi:glucose/arabinose dehydrogenase
MDLVEKEIKPDYALGSHTASLGLTFANGSSLGAAYRAVPSSANWILEPHCA